MWDKTMTIRDDGLPAVRCVGDHGDPLALRLSGEFVDADTYTWAADVRSQSDELVESFVVVDDSSTPTALDITISVDTAPLTPDREHRFDVQGTSGGDRITIARGTILASLDVTR